jgi:arginase
MQSGLRPCLRLIGVPTDRNCSFLRGPARAPAAIRAALLSDMGNASTESGLERDVDFTLRDVGDVQIDESASDDARIEAAAREAVVAGELPIFLGGDHSVTLPLLRGLAAKFGPLNVLHFDAHPDLYHSFEDNPRSHASPFARIMEEKLASRLVQVGIRTLNRHQQQQAGRFGVEILPMRGFEARSVPVLGGPLYVSLDLDALDPAFAPGVSHHEPGGLSVRDVLNVLDLQRAPLIGADIVELNPDRDLHGMTATVAAKFVKELCGYALTR